MSIFIITDLHLNHQKVKEFGGRPDNWQEILLLRWNNLVRSEDLVINLGDVIFKQASQLKEILSGLHGTKILIRGNHDKGTNEFYRRSGFACVCERMIMDQVYYSHVPQNILPGGCQWNVCGHIHNNPYDNMPDRAQYCFKSWHRVLSLEQMRYSPRLLSEVLSGMWHRRDLPLEPEHFDLETK